MSWWVESGELEQEKSLVFTREGSPGTRTCDLHELPKEAEGRKRKERNDK